MIIYRLPEAQQNRETRTLWGGRLTLYGENAYGDGVGELMEESRSSSVISYQQQHYSSNI